MSISRELHDEVGQMLTALRLELGNLEMLRDCRNSEFEEHMADSKALAERTLRTVRDIAMGLRPSMLDDLGLVPAIEWQAREFERQQPAYTYCIRTTAVYECPSYGADGSLRTTRQRVVAHGTGFGLRQQPGETLVVTNQHVVDGAQSISVRFWNGDSRGRWEGDTLVVETTNFLPRSVYRNANAERLTVTERFTPVSPTQLRWNVTLDDPSTWTKPWTFSVPLTLNPSEPMMPYECHEGNYGLKNILSAARAEERKAANSAKP